MSEPNPIEVDLLVLLSNRLRLALSFVFVVGMLIGAILF